MGGRRRFRRPVRAMRNCEADAAAFRTGRRCCGGFEPDQEEEGRQGQGERHVRPRSPPHLPGPIPRTIFTAADQDAAVIANIPNARFWADSEPEYLRALPTMRGPWLILSAGGEDGAYGAGLLGGWSKTGKRPEFSLVTGVSTGALIAPFAFLGPKYDEMLRDCLYHHQRGRHFRGRRQGREPARHLAAAWT